MSIVDKAKQAYEKSIVEDREKRALYLRDLIAKMLGEAVHPTSGVYYIGEGVYLSAGFFSDGEPGLAIHRQIDLHWQYSPTVSSLFRLGEYLKKEIWRECDRIPAQLLEDIAYSYPNKDILFYDHP